jgi:hypothetical protein
VNTPAAQLARGRWAKGQSGNPAGRPVGRINRAHHVLRELMLMDSQKVVRAVIDAAIAGDMVAARIVIDRLYPRKVRPLESIVLPVMRTPADACAAMAAITAAAITGEISTTEATELASVVDSFRRAIETSEVFTRLERLEQHARDHAERA